MKIEKFSAATQEGLRRWAREAQGDEMMLDSIASVPTEWAWVWFLLREAPDNPDWFPRGKAATLQCLEQWLIDEAR